MHNETRQQFDELRFRVCQEIGRGRLPVMLSDETAAGYGSGRSCAACGESIIETEAEYEVRDDRDQTPLAFHLRCYVVWQLECADATSVSGCAVPGRGPEPLTFEPFD